MNYIIPITSKWKIGFDFIIILLSIFYCTRVIFLVTFYNVDYIKSQETTGYLIFDYTLTTLYVIYMITNFFHSYQDSKTGEIIKNNKKIALHYLTRWFAVDFISTIPWGFFTKGWPSLLRLIRINKIFQFFTFVSRVNYKMRGTIRLMRLGFTGVFGTFLFSCLWYLICYAFKSNSEDNFLDHYNMTSTTSKSHQLNYNDIINAEEEDNSDYFQFLLKCYYFCLTTLTTTGFGDFTPKNTIERFFSILIMLLGVLFFSYLMSLLSEEISGDGDHQHIQSQKLISDLRKINMGKKSHFFDEKVNKNILDNVHFSTIKARADPDVSKYNRDILPHAIKSRLNKYLWNDIFEQICDYFCMLDTNIYAKFLNNLSSHFQYKYFLPRDVIYHPSYDSSEVFIIQKGYVDIDNPISRLKRRINPGEIIGHFYAIYHLKPSYIYLAVSNVEAVAIDKNVFDKAVRKYEKVFKVVSRSSTLKFREIFVSIANSKGRIAKKKKLLPTYLFDKVNHNENEKYAKDFKEIKKSMNSLINNNDTCLGENMLNNALLSTYTDTFKLEKKIISKIEMKKSNLILI